MTGDLRSRALADADRTRRETRPTLADEIRERLDEFVAEESADLVAQAVAAERARCVALLREGADLQRVQADLATGASIGRHLAAAAALGEVADRIERVADRPGLGPAPQAVPLSDTGGASSAVADRPPMAHHTSAPRSYPPRTRRAT